MKATAELINTASVREPSRLGLLSELFKARLTTLVLLTTLVGFYMGQRGSMDWVLMIHTLLATALVASGAAALNQYLERDYDALMQRTSERPLPAGRIQPETVLLLGGIISLLGLIYLALAVNLLTCILGAFTLAMYLWVYTPLKRITTLNTLVGAIPGALPPLMGWTAAQGEISLAGWSLFAILCVWQLPHFLAIAWMYRDDYARAGYVMLPVVDPQGDRTARQAICQTLVLMVLGWCPFLLGLSGKTYLVGSTVLGAAFLMMAVRFAVERTRGRARSLFLISIIYLPLLLGLMVLGRE